MGKRKNAKTETETAMATKKENKVERHKEEESGDVKPLLEKKSSQPYFMSSGFAKEDNFSDFFYKPHTATGLFIALVALVYFIFTRQSRGLEGDIKIGMTAAVLSFLIYCAYQLRDSILTRPHPVFWRVTHGISIIYLMFAIFTLFVTKDDARQLLKYLYSDLGQPLPERSYADDCRLHTPEKENQFSNIYDTVMDEFILAHLMGHFAKAVMLRDMKVAVFLSVFFEISEITLQHWLENFKECWWDHLIIDVLGCNLIGMFAGMWFVKYMEMKEYNWVGLGEIKGIGGKIKRIGKQFTPKSFEHYDWDIFSSFKRFFYIMMLVILTSITEVNGFFLKYLLWVPPRNLMNTYRLFIWWFLSLPALREFYEFVANPKVKRLGPNTWLAVAVCTVETLIVIKFGAGEFKKPFPRNISYSWAAFGILFTLWVLLYFPRLHYLKKTGKKGSKFVTFMLWALFYVSWAPQVFLFLSGMPDLRIGEDYFNSLFDSHGKLLGII